MADSRPPIRSPRITLKVLAKTGGFWSPPHLIDIPVYQDGDEYVIEGTKWDGFRFPIGHVGTLHIPERKKKDA